MQSRITAHRNRRNERPGAGGVPELNWTEYYRPDLAKHPRARLEPLRQYADPAHVAHIAQGDMINWPYNPASYQVFVMNGWNGNQLPGTHKRPWNNPNVNPEWERPGTQRQNHALFKGEFGPQMSQKTSQGILQSVGQMWANVRSQNSGG